MASKTYIPQLLFWAKFSHKYMTRWQTKLEANLTTEQYACLTAAISALQALLICVGAPTPGP